ncbi:MAG: anthranilate synthase component I family protein [Brevundimonas sp.]|uniref:anthranilate synthase component I family protein n=1 Tax=Brevundimonas sp. TaxID=1871086 RepID=UPI001219559F|nr:chorismate-binding protein [Brevundimonas sp.]RZJ17676.1 MAG: anthranilate synthase component I family protein [Brevundimonas sp.]
MTSVLTHRVQRERPWRDPLAVATGLRDAPGVVALISDGGSTGRWSHVAAFPDAVHVGPADMDRPFEALRDPVWGEGVVGLASYDLGARLATGVRETVWPDLMLARYPAMLSFDHHQQQVRITGLGADATRAGAAADHAEAWLAQAIDTATPPPPADAFTAEAPDAAYLSAVADVVRRIGEGELFQANIARAWAGALNADADPFDVFRRLAARASAYGAFWRLDDRALVSNSPELFLSFDPADRRIETRPIKGTRQRRADPADDRAEAEALSASVKDRAENLMIVDLMRNDLSRVCTPGSVRTEQLFTVDSLPTVHHLVSTVSGRVGDGAGPADMLQAAFPPGSITGAPKHQAMKVIAAHEPPRGPWCGSLFLIGEGGALTSSVLIRTADFGLRDGVWRWRALAGAGIVADSDPAAELDETEAKIRALREALAG